MYTFRSLRLKIRISEFIQLMEWGFSKYATGPVIWRIGGGGDRNSNMLFKILKAYLKNNNIYVLTNHITASNAEQLAHKLSKFENCQIFGQRTNGTLGYELVNSNYELPCDDFISSLTAKTHSEYLDFESIGIEPNVQFDMESDWINQMVHRIEANDSNH